MNESEELFNRKGHEGKSSIKNNKAEGFVDTASASVRA